VGKIVVVALVAEGNIELGIEGQEGQNMEDCRAVGKVPRVGEYALG
jgi:hypothetical protein